MYTVLKQIKRSFAVYSALIIALITRVRSHQMPCGQHALTECAKPLSVLTNSRLTFVSNKDDLDRICPDLKRALKCIHSYTRHCMSLKERSHFKMLFHGTGVMVHELCSNGTYQEEFLKYAPCMSAVSKQSEVCFNRYSRAMKDIQSKSNEADEEVIKIEVDEEADIVLTQKKKREARNESIKSVCCSFQEYVECSTQAMRRTCGDEAAKFSRGFHDRMASSMKQQHCQQYLSSECGIYSSSSRIDFTGVLLPLLAIVGYLLR